MRKFFENKLHARGNQDQKSYSEKLTRYEDWLIEFQDPVVKEKVKSWAAHFKPLFVDYAGRNVNEKDLVMDQKEMLKFCADTKIVPQLISRNVATKLFKGC